MAKKKVVSGLTLLFLEETHSDNKNSGNVGNGDAKLANSDTTETKKETESVVEKEKEKDACTTEENAMSMFVMPLHYPSFTKKDYQVMPQWKLDQLFTEYGLTSVKGDLDYKRKFAMGAFLWSESGSCEEPEVSPMHGCQESSPKSKKAKMVEFLRHLLGSA